MPTNDKPVKLSAKLPKSPEANGLSSIHDLLNRYRPGIIIASVVVPEVNEQYGGTRQPVMVIEHIEGLPAGELQAAGEALMERARLARDKRLDTIPGVDDRDPVDWNGINSINGPHEPGDLGRTGRETD